MTVWEDLCDDATHTAWTDILYERVSPQDLPAEPVGSQQRTRAAEIIASLQRSARRPSITAANVHMHLALVGFTHKLFALGWKGRNGLVLSNESEDGRFA